MHDPHPPEGGHSLRDVPCCPQLEPCATCDTIDIRFRLPFRRTRDGRPLPVPVQAVLHFQLERCKGPLALGDLVYTTTLLPGERVRLFTSDRHSRFSFDSASDLAYRHSTTSEESFYMSGMAQSMSDLSIVENENRSSSFHESSVGGGGGAGLDLGFVEIGGSVSASSYDASSTSALARSLSRHAQTSSRHVEQGVRAASSVSVGEVQTRQHAEGESEEHFESASRSFANPNRCHALTFLFYRIDKCMTVRFRLVGVELHAADGAAPTGFTLNPPARTGGVTVVPATVLATDDRRLEVEHRARQSVLEEQRAQGFAAPGAIRERADAREPVAAKARDEALAMVTDELREAGLHVSGDEPPPEGAHDRFGWEREIALPTPGIVVRGCLDECEVCEPTLDEEIRLELKRKDLENQLLARQIELLEKSQDYRCCPGAAEPGDPADG